MTSKALGLIETIGLPAAIEAADAAAKSANITLLGYENAHGGGRITVKMVGDVGAVQAAVSAGSAAALRIGQVVSCLVIPRPHEEIAALIDQVDRGRVAAAPTATPPQPATLKSTTTVTAKSTAVKRPAPKSAAPAPQPRPSSAKPAKLALPAKKAATPPAKLVPHTEMPTVPPAVPSAGGLTEPNSPDRPEEPPAAS